MRKNSGTCNFRYLASFPNAKENVGLVLLSEILLIILCRAFTSASSHTAELSVALDLLPVDVKVGDAAPVGLNRYLGITGQANRSGAGITGYWGPPQRQGPCQVCKEPHTPGRAYTGWPK